MNSTEMKIADMVQREMALFASLQDLVQYVKQYGLDISRPIRRQLTGWLYSRDERKRMPILDLLDTQGEAELVRIITIKLHN